MTDAGRPLLVLMVGFSILLHGLFITGLPHLPWFNRPPDIYRLTRYVVRFNTPSPTPVPMLTQVAVAEPIPIEPAPVEPLADLRTPKPIERVATLPEQTIEPLTAPTPVQPVTPRPPELRHRAAARTRPRVETRLDPIVKPRVAPALAQPVTPRPPELRHRAAARTRPRVETRLDPIVKPRVAPALARPVIPKPLEQRQHRAAEPRERVVAPARQPRPDVAPVEPVPQPVVVKPVPRRRAATPRSRTAARTTGRQAPGRVAAAVPQAAAPVPTRVAALPQPRQPSPAAVLQAQAEQEQDAIQSYLGFVFQSLERHKRYPRVAERRGLSGRVVLRFTVRWDGEVIDPQVVEVTGHDAFGDAARRALTRVGQLPRFPDEIRRRELLVEVPITYRFENR